MLSVFTGKMRKSSEGEFEVSDTIPAGDVKKGHFAVMAMKGSEKRRFIVKIKCLSNPKFLRLLEQAEQEFGFEQTGTLVVPCRPQEFQKILKSCGYNFM